MPFLSLFFVIFGFTILIFPQFLAYIIGFLFLFIGINGVVFSLLMRKRSQEGEKGWKFGGYEIIRRR